MDGSAEGLAEDGPAPPATPMMAQYLEIKARHPDALLLYRMGDFYELFLADAEVAAEALDIQLTRRGSHAGREVPMCGVPVAGAEPYLLALIRKGFRVAVAEQLEDPAQARARGGAKALVRRDVVRVLTPGTLTEDALLEGRRANWLAALSPGAAAIAWADLSTGAFHVRALGRGDLAAELARLMPREVLHDEADRAAGAAAEAAGAQGVGLPRAAFDARGGARRLAEYLGVATLDAFGAFAGPEVAAMAALAGYLDLTQKGARGALRPPRREEAGAAMALDPATRASLELTRGSGGAREGSLLACLDRTLTPGGARLLESRLSAPSRALAEVTARLDAVAALVADPALADALRAALKASGDPERALSRLALGRGGPRDLGRVRDALTAGRVAQGLLPPDLPPLLASARAALAPATLAPLALRLDAALVPAPPILARDGGLVAAGFSPELDGLRAARAGGLGALAALEAEYVALTGIASLKVRHNGSLGYVVETTATHAARMMAPPLSGTFRHRQTTGSCLRFATDALLAAEAQLARAGEEALALEARAFEALREEALAQADGLAALAAALAEADVAAALALAAREGGWTRPAVEDGTAFAVEGGRHPVVEAALRRGGEGFVANACDLTDAPLMLLTGPNMGGKSTYLRQNALIAILAQAGSFVPATRARIGLVSRVWSRVGAADDIGRGRSTFMVEMVETAAILHGADEFALVILDEVGRGTATWDGLSIAWAVVEHLAGVNRCRALFATHYHELAGLAARLPGASNAHVAVAEWEGEVVLLHEVRDGPIDRSYGVQVARLAGLPARAVARARAVLRALEKGDRATAALDELPLFAAAEEEAPRPSAAESRLRALRPDELSPREALEALYELRALL